MNKQNTDKLFQEFPTFWYEPHDMTKSLMCFGFEHGDGWFDLIYNLCKNIQKELDKEKPKYPFYVLQVKEKFGGLRFYYSGGNDAIEKLIDIAEEKSYHICESCGKYFKTNPPTKNWTYCLCKKCYSNMITKRNKETRK